MRRSHLSYLFLLSLLGSIFLLQWWQESQYPTELWLTLAILLGSSIFVLLFEKTRKPAATILSLTLGLTVAFAAVARTTHVPTERSIDWYATDIEVTVEGMIADLPDIREDGIRYTVETSKLLIDGQALDVEGQILATDRGMRERFAYGDRVDIRGTLSKPGVIEDFHYDNYLSRYGIYALVTRAIIERSGANTGNPWLRRIYGVKDGTEIVIQSLYPEPQASLLAGLITGSRGMMPVALQDSFKITGLTHLVAISGYNITMIITVLGTLLFWLPLRWRYMPSVLIIAAFTLFTGASASVVRAAIMGMLGLTALQLGRTQTLRLTLLWTVCFMLLWNPKQLWYDAGFHLSFLALLGVTEVSPFLKYVTTWLPERFGIRESLTLTLSAQITTIPWMLHLFGRLSLISPLANLIVPPAVPWATLLGIGSVILGSLSPALGPIASIPVFLLLTWMTFAASLLAAVPLASVGLTMGTMPMAAFYMALIAFLIHLNRTSTCTGESSSPPPALSSAAALQGG